MRHTSKIQFSQLIIWLKDQLSHPHTLFKKKTWGVYSKYAHVRRSDHRPKIASPTKDKALSVAKSMEDKYGGKYSIYKCLYCNGWHVAKEQSYNVIKTETFPIFSSIQVRNTLDIDKLAALNIPDFALVYGGVRGRTLSSRYQSFAWPTIQEAGIKTIIDLRADGVYSQLSDLCKKYGLDYFYYPVDNKCENIESMVSLFPELCRHIDNGKFYIACAMGLHRTDIAICLYWVFYGADKGFAPPEIRGYRKNQGHNTDKIMRVINEFYRYITVTTGKEPISKSILIERKAIIEEQSKN